MSELADTTAATVTELLPNRLYRLELIDGNIVTAGISEELKRLGTTFKAGQRVLVRRTRLDPGQGIILGPAREPTNRTHP
jgi:translation initiation factor IF-1